MRSDFERLHAGENVHAYNLPSTLIAADGTALCVELYIFKLGVSARNYLKRLKPRILSGLYRRPKGLLHPVTGYIQA